LAQTGTGNADGDAFSNDQEFRAGTHPNQVGSELRVVEPEIVGNVLTLRWPASANRRYQVYSAPDPSGPWTLEADLNPPVISSGHATWMAPAPAGRRYYQVQTNFLP
jgi:hypothetical protein